MIEYIKNELDIEELKDMVYEVNCWNGSLDYLEIYDNDECFFNDFFRDKVLDAVRAVSYGDYNYNDEYVRFDGYGNLKSFDEFEYDEEIEDYAEDIIEAYIDEIDDMSDGALKNKVKDLMEEYEENEQDGEENK